MSFTKKIANHAPSIKRQFLDVLQINLGKLCNQACHHCHVEAGPKRTEVMHKKTMERLLELLDKTPSCNTIDITGGAPELNPAFRFLVSELYNRKKQIIDRCNLTVLFEKGQEDTAYFLREHRVKIVASLPCYTKQNVETQRGGGVFDKSISALQMLNKLGYGQEGSGLELDLVYNPQGAYLPPAQDKLEKDYKIELQKYFGISFNQLFTITNMPIKRFLDQLTRENKYNAYMQLLVSSFNVQTLDNLMCRNMISVSWDGKIYDCDFNQMLQISVGNTSKTIWDINALDDINKHAIAFANHCYGCTAGAGSSCGGAIA